MRPRPTQGSAEGSVDESGKPNKRGAAKIKDHRPAKSTAVLPAHPSWRVAALTVTAMLLLAAGEGQLLARANLSRGYSSAKGGFDQCMAALQQMKGDTSRLVHLWQVGKQHDVPHRPDDVIHESSASDGKSWDLTIFSDFECPSCKRTARFLERTVSRMFDGRLRIFFKHFPLNTDCNTAVARTIHPSACEASKWAEAARLQGGANAFRRAHDWLFEQQKHPSGLIGVDFSAMAAALGLDVGQLQTDLESPATAQRLQEDVQLARQCGLRSTPYILVNGRVVDGVAAKEVNFWNALADQFWAEVGIVRPESTKLATETDQQASAGGSSPHSK
jgi:protein-disulfide isomerase